MKLLPMAALLLLWGAETANTADIAAAYRLPDFYFYNEAGLAEKLTLLPEFVIFFNDPYPSEANINFFALFNERIAKVTDICFNSQSECVIVEFEFDAEKAKNNQAKIVEKLNAAVRLAAAIAEIRPVVVINGRKMTPSNKIVVETPPAINQERLRDRLMEVSSNKNLGEFQVDALLPYADLPRHYELEVSNLRWPPNVLVLANLLCEQNWIKRAQVNFQSLAFPLSISFQVKPNGFPTLGEKRFLIMTIVSDLDFAVDRNLLPRLGYGEFYLSEPLPEVFFRSGSAKVWSAAKEFERITIVEWPFWIYAPGNYHFAAVNIPYTNIKTGEKLTVEVAPGEVGVNSIINGSEIDDIQPLTSFAYPAKLDKTSLNIAKWINAQFVGSLLALLSFVALCGGVCWLASGMSEERREDRSDDKRQITDALTAAAAGLLLDENGNIEELEKLLRKAAVDIFGLDYNIQPEEAAALSADSLADKDVWQAWENVLILMERRQSRDFRLTPEFLTELSGWLAVIVQEAKERVND